MSATQPLAAMAASLRFAAQLPRSSARCPQCFRTFSSYKPFRQSSRREMQTATAYQPSTLNTPPPPPRNSPSPHSAIAEDDTPDNTVARWQEHKSLASASGHTKSEAGITEKQTSAESPASQQKPSGSARPRRFNFGARKAVIKLSPTAIHHLKLLLEQPEPKMIKIGTKNKGCSGLAYDLQYVDGPSKLDEKVVQDGVTVLVDNRALLNIIGSEMDWIEDKLSARFVFKNPNITEQCGCGESFSVS